MERLLFVLTGALWGLCIAGPVYLIGCWLAGYPASAELPSWAVALWPVFPAVGAAYGWSFYSRRFA